MSDWCERLWQMMKSLPQLALLLLVKLPKIPLLDISLIYTYTSSPKEVSYVFNNLSFFMWWVVVYLIEITNWLRERIALG